MDYENVKKILLDYGKLFLSVFGIYLGWIILHYIAAHLYVKLCVSGTVLGFILAPFLATSPHCQGLRWAVYNGGNSISTMWVLFGVWLTKYLTPIKPN
jgi:hypothetical protein